MPRKNKGLSLRAAARELGLDESTLRQHDKAGLVIRDSDDCIDIDATQQSLKDNLDPHRGGKRTTGKSKTTLTEARTRKEIAHARKAEIETALLEDEVILIAEAEALYIDVASRVRAAIEAIPTRMMHRLVGLEPPAIRKLLTDEIDLALRGIDDPPKPKHKHKRTTD